MMTDPHYFRIRGGANPHTRSAWGRRKRVDRGRSLKHWQQLAGTLRDAGVAVFVIPPNPALPGMVYPANGGFLYRADEEIPASEKTFYLSNLVPHRAREWRYYWRFVRGMGFGAANMPYRFEGEADFFPCGEDFLFFHGPVIDQHWALQSQAPFVRRVYGFRSDARNLHRLQEIVGPGTRILSLTLVNEAHYHGDTVACSFGPRRQWLLLYESALSRDSVAMLKNRLGDRIIALSDPDGGKFVANCYGARTDSGYKLFLPHTASPEVLDRIKAKGVEPVRVNVSEFMEKGGGSIKCMVGDLGRIDFDERVTEEVRQFRQEHRYT
ncbi:MAG: hypothetical protein JW937_01965 [Candidatus Omnitrophica bacterium]|nr:hypothetical protein [Candidatus Omnitrophota bacterium]